MLETLWLKVLLFLWVSIQELSHLTICYVIFRMLLLYMVTCVFNVPRVFIFLTFPGTWLGIAELWGISHRQEIPLVVFSTNTTSGVTFSQVCICRS